MANFDEFFEQLIERDMKFVEALLGPTDEVREEILEYVQKEEEKKVECIKNGQSYIPDWSKYEELTIRYEETAELSAKLVAEFETSLPTIENKEKENTPVLSDTSSSTTTKNSRPKRAAFREASQMINKQVNMKLNDKLRREDVIDKQSLNTHIKTEKLSTIKNTDNKKNDIGDGDDVDNEIMPPPISLPIKIKPNRRIKKERSAISVIPEDDSEIVDIDKIKQETNTNRGSDVILQEPRVSLVDLTISTTSSSSSVSKPTNNDDSTRGTYVIEKPTKTKQSSKKRSRNYASSDDKIEKSLKKRSKINSNVDNMDANDTEQTHYDDAMSDIVDVQQQQINATFVAKSPILLNTTVVLEKHQQFVANIPNDLLTDDESDVDDNEQKQSKHNTKQLKTAKHVFSAFDQSPVKEKVKAFEKLGASTTNVPVRVTRTKTRALEKQQQQEKSKQQDLAINNSIKLLPTNNVKEKAKFFSPLPTKIKQPTIKTTQTTIKTKSDEKIIDIAEKRNVHLQQIMDERRRKREEKELKAQQQREAIEREKLKKLEEQEKLKEERHKRLLYEQEQKKIKLREEAERKRLLVKQNALKEKQKQQQQQTLEKPKYLTMETPRLPTIDCYDSDEENYRTKKITAPSWCEDKNLRRFQFIMSFGGEKIKNTFFSREAQTVDLQDLFQTNNPRVLKRTSSAHWTKPPKYSILPTRFESSFEHNLETTNEKEAED